MAELDGRVAIVTGAGRGIGRATAEALAAAGAAVLCCARNSGQVEDTAATINAAGGRAHALALDISDEADVAVLFDALPGFGQGRLDILVNNAATLIVKPFAEMTIVEWDSVLDTNLRGVFLCSQRAFQLMQLHGGGCIVNLGSLSGVPNVEKFPGLSAYNVSKYGVLGLTEIMAVEGKPHGIRVNAVSPGAVDTEMLRAAAPHLRTSTTPADVADTILYLVSDRARHISGANMIIFSNE